MTISVDAATVARVADDGDSSGVTGSFSVPANTLILVGISANSGGTPPVITVSDTLTLSWTKETGTEGSSGGAWAQWAWAYSVAGGTTAITVTTDLTEEHTFKVYLVSGADSAAPIAQATNGVVNADPANFNAYTSSVNNSRGFAVCADWGATGAPASTDTEDSFHIPSSMSGMSAYKAADTTPASTVVAFNYDSAGTPELGWAALEIRPAAIAHSSLSPADGATGVSTGASLAVTFAENVDIGTGNVRVYSVVPVAAAPTVATRGTDTTGTGDTTSFQIDWTISGGTYAAKTRVICLISKDDDDAFTSFPPTDWTEIFNVNSGTATRVAAIYRDFAAGASTSSVTVTGDSESYAARTWQITGYDEFTAPYCPTPATGASTAANPPSATYPWGNDHTLVLAVCGGDGNGSASGFPGSTSDTGTHTSGHTTAGSRSWLAYAEFASDTNGAEDPSAFTNTNEEWVAATIAIRGARTITLEETIAITNGGQVPVSTVTVTITLTGGTLDASTPYAVQVDAGAIVADDDAAPWAGIPVGDFTTWNFATGAATGAAPPGGAGPYALNVRRNPVYRM